MSKEVREALKRLDSHITELMTCAEKQYRMLYKNDYSFGLKVKTLARERMSNQSTRQIHTWKGM